MMKLSTVMLGHLGKDLSHLLGPEEGRTVTALVQSLDDATRDATAAEIGRRRSRFDALPDKDKEERRAVSAAEWIKDYDWKSHRVPCPSCSELAVLNTEVVQYLEPSVGEDQIIERAVVQPRRLKCRCCGLDLDGFGAVAEAGLSDQRISENSVDPVDYYGIEFDPEEHISDDYGND